MSIRELSFCSPLPLTRLPYLRHKLRLQQAVAPNELPWALGKLANRLKRQYKLPILCDPVSVALISPIALRDCDEFFTVITQEIIDLSDRHHQRLLLQACNFALYRAFESASSSPTIDRALKRLYSRQVTQISPQIESQRYLTFDFLQDGQQRLILALDFANSYRSVLTLEKLGLPTLKSGQRLIEIYDNKSCEFVAIASETISTPLRELGNQSLIEYHQQRQHFAGNLLDNLDRSTPAIEVCYSPSGKRPFRAKHIPQLLRKIYDRTEVTTPDFERQLWSIEQKVEKAQQTIQFLGNKNKFFLNCYENQSLPIKFSEDLRVLDKLQYFLSGTKARKLDFGEIAVSYPSAALKRGHLFQQPEAINAVILSPESWQPFVLQYINQLRQEFNRFRIELRQDLQTYNPLREIEINQRCQNLRECDFVIAFVPESEHPDYQDKINPYQRLKNQLFKRKIPSQMINHKTLRKGCNSWDKNVGYNLVLGINAKLGYLNWQLTDMPGTAQAFIGLDIGRKNNRTVGASAFVLDHQGQLIGWSAKELSAYQETFDTEGLRNLVLDLFSLYQGEYQAPLKHLVIHRDGELQKSEYEALVELKSYLQSEGLEQLDVVEVIKTGTCRAVEVTKENSYQNPEKGYAWEHCPQEAIILTTGRREAKVSRKSSPRPLRIRQRLGETDLMILAEQVYWLSEMQVGSTQTIRLPITTYYADKAAEWVLKGLLSSEVHHDKRLWFL